LLAPVDLEAARPGPVTTVDRTELILEAAPELRRQVLETALRAYDQALARGDVRKHILTIIDYTRPSTSRRLWVIELGDVPLVRHFEHVAHGRGSGDGVFATEFSNLPGSRASSLGVFRTRRIYHGRHGYSLRLQGLEPGFNDRAHERTLVFHSAWYMSPEYVNQYGVVGSSWGCPALEDRAARFIIDYIKRGSLVVAYYPDADWLAESTYLNPGKLTRRRARRLALSKESRRNLRARRTVSRARVARAQ
jgi:hypothetical protein